MEIMELKILRKFKLMCINYFLKIINISLLFIKHFIIKIIDNINIIDYYFEIINIIKVF